MSQKSNTRHGKLPVFPVICHGHFCTLFTRKRWYDQIWDDCLNLTSPVKFWLHEVGMTRLRKLGDTTQKHETDLSSNRKSHLSFGWQCPHRASNSPPPHWGASAYPSGSIHHPRPMGSAPRKKTNKHFLHNLQMHCTIWQKMKWKTPMNNWNPQMLEPWGYFRACRNNPQKPDRSWNVCAVPKTKGKPSTTYHSRGTKKTETRTGVIS